VTKRICSLLVAVAIFFCIREARAGYTHYWRWRIVPDGAALEASLVEMDKLADAKRSILTDRRGQTGGNARFRGWCDWGKDAGETPDGGETPCIGFNGVGPDEHETFGFPLAPFTNDPAFSFVKTAAKPYDVVVAASLIVARDHFAPDALEISSDGTWPEDFAAAAQLYEQVLKRRPRDPRSPALDRGGAPEGPPVSANASRVRWLLFGLIAIAFLGVLVVYRRQS
jgi:hypothetical protein